MRHGESKLLGRLTDFVGRHAYLVLGLWIIVAAGLNLVAPRLEQVAVDKSGPLMPDSAPSLIAVKNMGIQFGESQASAIGYLVLEDDRGFNDADRTYYDEIITKLRSNQSQIDSVQDLLSDPATAHIAASEDGKAVYATVRFYGGVGSATQREGQSFVRALIEGTPKPDGLAVYQTGPAPTIGDEIAAQEHSVTLITAVIIGMIVVLLLCIYRRFSTILVPLISVGLALAVSRPIVALLGMHAGLDISIFSVMLLAAIVLGAGTDYAVFLLSGYHQGRRRGKSSHESIVTTATQISGIIVASGLTVAASCAVMSATQIVLFRTTGLPCSIGVIVAVFAALTLVPALLSILGRRGLVEPRGDAATTRYWRRVGALIVRRPARVLAASLAILLALAAPTLWMSSGYDERSMQPATTPSNQGYGAIARHYETSELTPDVLLIEADRDLRNSADFAALNSVIRSVQKVRGVSEVRGPTQPEGKAIPEFTLGGQVRALTDKLTSAIRGISDNQPKLGQLEEGIQQLTDGLGQLSVGNTLAAEGSGRIQNGMEQLRSGLSAALNGSKELSGGADRLADGSQEMADSIDSVVTPILTQLNIFVPPPPSDETCQQDSNCAEGDQLAILAQDTSPIGRVRYLLTRLKVGSRQLADGNHHLSDGMHQLQSGLAAASDGTIKLTDGQKLLTTKLGEISAGAAAARSGVGQISNGIKQISPQMHDLIDGLSQARDFLNEVSSNVSGTDAGFYVPKGAFRDPRLMQAMSYFISKDGHSARLLVFGDTTAYDRNAIGRLDAVIDSTNAALAETTLKGSRVEAGGLAAGFRDLHRMVVEDFAIIAAFALLFIFTILAWLLGGLIAPLYLIVTIAISYLSALGLSVLFWQGLFGMDVYWAVPPVAFVALVAVGSDYNLLFMSRIRANSTLGIRSGIVKAFRATGGVITTAGVIFAVTMLAMLASPVYTIAQIGFTIGAGLLIDTFIVRTLTVPAVAALLGARVWWPTRTLQT